MNSDSSTLRFVTVKRIFGHGLKHSAKATAGADSKPVWNIVMPAGTYHRASFPDGVQTLDRSVFEKVIANWEEMGKPGLPINRHHWGDSDDTRVRAEDKIAVGWIEGLRVNASGDLEALTNWNDDGREDITKDRRRYISPEWYWNFVNPQTGKDQGPTLAGAALLNDPFFQDLPRMAASVDPEAPTTENTMDPKKLRASLGLAADATDAVVEARLKELAAAEKTAKETGAAGERATADLKEKLSAETAAREASEKRIAELEKAQKETAAKALEKDALALCSKLEREGRIIATQKEDVIEDVKTHGLEKATKRWEKVPVKVVLKEIGSGGEGGLESKESAHKKFMELVDAAQKANTALNTSQAFSKVKADNPEIARAAFAQN